MTSRRTFLQRLGAAGIAPVAGSMVLTDPYMVASAAGVLVPDNTLVAPTPEQPLVLATDTMPTMVVPVEAWLEEVDASITRLSLDTFRNGMAYGSPNRVTRMTMRLPSLSDQQVYDLLAMQGKMIKIWT